MSSRHAYDLGLDRLARRAERSDWINRPHWIYALADLANAAEFPAAFLQPPLFDPEMDDAYNYAGVGFVIAHELGHNFDHQGRLMDAGCTRRCRPRGVSSAPASRRRSRSWARRGWCGWLAASARPPGTPA